MQQQQQQQAPAKTFNGGRFDFDDGGTYCGGWEDGKAHGHGVCTGPKGQGEYSGSWHFGFEVSGVYTWPSGSTYEGQWQNGKRHGLGVETRGRWLYRGEWTQGFKGRYGVRQSATSNAKYEGTWSNGLQDGYGSETYADGGTYQGQWLRGMRHGYGVRASAPFGMASHYRPNKPLRASLTSLRSDAPGDLGTERDRRVDDGRGGFVLKSRSDEPPTTRRRSLGERSSNFKKSILSGLKIRKQRSTGDLEKRGTSASIRSTGSSASWVSTESSQSAVMGGSIHTDSNASFVVEDEQMDTNVTETYMGEWKNDKRSGFGISERSDGLRYEGEWFNNKKYGYGVTTLKDGSKEEGKYKNNVLITSQKKKHLFLIRSAKFRERIDAAVNAAQRASKIALQKADIAISRTATARGKAEHADIAALHAREDSDIARITAKQFAPDFHQPGIETLRVQLAARGGMTDISKLGPIKPRDEASPNNRSKSMYVPPAKPEPEVTANRVEPQPPSQPENIAPPPQPSVPQIVTNSEPVSQPYMNKIGSDIPNRLPVKPSQSFRERSVAPESEQPPQRGTTPVPALRRGSKVNTSDHPGYSFQQAMSDHFDHYQRPPSRESSLDRYSRAARMSRQPSAENPTVSRAPSRQRTPGFSTEPEELPGLRKRGTTPAANETPVPTGNGSVVGDTGGYTVPASPFEEVIIRQKGLGQDILPSPGQPKRTESLYINPGKRREAPPKNIPSPSVLQRKKSLPDVQVLPKATEPMSREEVSVLSSARREEVRRMQDEADRLRANPLLYLVSPNVKDWFSRQQLMMLVLFINISLAIMFFKLLT